MKDGNLTKTVGECDTFQLEANPHKKAKSTNFPTQLQVGVKVLPPALKFDWGCSLSILISPYAI